MEKYTLISPKINVIPTAAATRQTRGTNKKIEICVAVAVLHPR